MTKVVPGVAPRIRAGAPTRGAFLGVGAAALAAALMLGAEPTALAVLLLGALFAWGLPVLMRSPAAPGSSVVIGGVVVAGVADAMAFPEHDMQPTILALSVIAAFLHEMFRRDGRPRLVESVSTTVTGNVVAISAASWIAVAADGVGLGLVVAASLLVAAAPTFFRLPVALEAALSILGGAAAGALLGSAVPGIDALNSLLLGFTGAVIVASVHVVLRTFPRRQAPEAVVAGALLPLLALGLPVAQLTNFL